MKDALLAKLAGNDVLAIRKMHEMIRSSRDDIATLTRKLIEQFGPKDTGAQK